MMNNTNNKISVTYFFRKQQPQYFSIEKVFEQVIDHLPKNVEPIIYKLKNGTNGWWGRLKALLEVWKNRGTINHITGDITFIALALPKKGLVVTYHDLESLSQYKGWRFRLLKWLWVSIPVKRALVVTAISQHTKEQLIKWTRCNPDKIKVIQNPLPDEIKYSPKAFNVLCPHILVMGTKANKNVERIFEAVGGLKDKAEKSEDERPETEAKYYKLIVVGKMTELQIAMAKKYQLDIENLVQVPYDKILDAYKRCDLLCFPSFYEGFGLPIIEAQATGRSVITSHFGAMKEVAREGAVLVDPYKTEEIENALLSVIGGAGFREQLVQKGKDNINRFEGKVIAGLYAEIYQHNK